MPFRGFLFTGLGFKFRVSAPSSLIVFDCDTSTHVDEYDRR